MSRAPRVVLDTNVVLSALVFGKGRLAALRIGWQQQLFIPLVSKATASEIIRVLSYPKFKLSAADQHELLADYLPYCVTVRAPAKSPQLPTCRDPYDVPFLQLAVVGKAQFLVSGDADLLSLAGRLACRIVSPEEFLQTGLSGH